MKLRAEQSRAKPTRESQDQSSGSAISPVVSIAMSCPRSPLQSTAKRFRYHHLVASICSFDVGYDVLFRAWLLPNQSAPSRPTVCATVSTQRCAWTIRHAPTRPCSPVPPPIKTLMTLRTTFLRTNIQRCSAGLPMVQVSVPASCPTCESTVRANLSAH